MSSLIRRARTVVGSHRFVHLVSPLLVSPRVAAGLGLGLALLDSWVERMTRLGYKRADARSTVTWSLARLTLRRGDPDLTTITADDIRALGEELRSYCARPEAGRQRLQGARRYPVWPSQNLGRNRVCGFN